MKTKLYFYLIVGFALFLVFGKIATAVSTSDDDWALYYHGLGQAKAGLNQSPTIAWIGVRNESAKVQTFTLDTLDLVIEDGNGYKYPLSFGFDLPWQALPQRSNSNLTDIWFDSPRKIAIPPGASFLVPFRYSMPVNAPSPQIVFSRGFLGLGARRVSLESPETGFVSPIPQIDYSPVILKKGDVTVSVNRAWWWDDCLVVLELQVNNRGGTDLVWNDKVGIFDLSGSQLAASTRMSAFPRECRATGVPMSQMFQSLNFWRVSGYSDKLIYYFFAPHQDDLGRNEFTLSVYRIVAHPDSPWISSFWDTLEAQHATSLPVLASPPADAPVSLDDFTVPQ